MVFKCFQLGERSEEYRLRSTELQTTLENVVVRFVHFHCFHRYVQLFGFKKKNIPSCAKIARELAYPLNMFYEKVSSRMLWTCNYFEWKIKESQWNLDITNAQGTGKVSSLLTRSGFVLVSRFFSLHFTITATWAKNIVPYTYDFIIYMYRGSLHRGSTMCGSRRVLSLSSSAATPSLFCTRLLSIIVKYCKCIAFNLTVNLKFFAA